MGNLLTLLRDAHEGGLRLAVHSGRLRIRGPKSASGIVRALAEHKADVVAVVELVSSLIGVTTRADEATAVESAQPQYPWREELPTWSIEWRERWGRRANQLADEGVLWPEDERRAFAEVSHERMFHVRAQPRLDPSS